MFSNCGVWRRTLESPLDCKEIKPINPKGTQPWILIGTTHAKAEAPVLWLPDAKSQLLENTLMMGKIEGRRRGDDRGWDGWMASLTWWTWVWASSGSGWWAGKLGMLQSMGSQRVRHNWVTEQLLKPDFYRVILGMYLSSILFFSHGTLGKIGWFVFIYLLLK